MTLVDRDPDDTRYQLVASLRRLVMCWSADFALTSWEGDNREFGPTYRPHTARQASASLRC
jgi:hypothetical protein